MASDIRILIVEDEAVLAMDLTDLLEEEGYSVVGTANNGRKALRLHQEQRIDLALCDISIKGDWDGIQTAEHLVTERPIPIIFLTALIDKATLERAMTSRPAAYLIKPITVPGLRAAIELALRQFIQPEPVSVEESASSPSLLTPAETIGEPMLRIDNAVFIKHKYQFVKIRLDDIEYLEADSAYTAVVTATQRFALRLTLGQVLTRLNFARLVRIHRSYAVNLNRVETFNEREVSLAGHTLPLGRFYKEEFLRNFSIR